jgi:hypothetical protein
MYEKLYRLALRTRGDRAEDGLDNPFWITPTELISEWRKLKAREKEILGEKPRAICTFPHENEEDRLVWYFRSYDKGGVLLPCHSCRPKAHAARKAELIHAEKPTTDAISNVTAISRRKEPDA